MAGFTFTIFFFFLFSFSFCILDRTQTITTTASYVVLMYIWTYSSSTRGQKTTRITEVHAWFSSLWMNEWMNEWMKEWIFVFIVLFVYCVLLSINAVVFHFFLFRFSSLKMNPHLFWSTHNTHIHKCMNNV